MGILNMIAKDCTSCSSSSSCELINYKAVWRKFGKKSLVIILHDHYIISSDYVINQSWTN